MGPNPGVLLLTSVDVPSGPPAERLLKSNCNVFGVSQEAAYLLSITEILNHQLGYGLSLRQGVSVLGDGRPIPLISYGLTEYLLSLDLSGFDVLELGGGQSTFFWSSKARSVCTLEHDLEWVRAIEAAKLGNSRIVRVQPEDYASTISALPDEYDLIVIDCAANRYECAIAAGRKLRAAGMIVLDNSDWYPNTAAHLRSLDLIQVDFPDFPAVASLPVHDVDFPAPGVPAGSDPTRLSANPDRRQGNRGRQLLGLSGGSCAAGRKRTDAEELSGWSARLRPAIRRSAAPDPLAPSPARTDQLVRWRAAGP